jgi:Asp/Glu/hydantoin racemase
MQYQNRDFGIKQIFTRKKHTCYGMGIGIMILDDVYPGFPGDVRNASGFPYPIQYEIVEGIDIKQLIWNKDKSPCLKPILKAAKKLEKMGCRAIAAECGYFAYFQPEVADAVDIPVFMSSLLQVPLIQQIIGPKKDVGIVCYQKQFLTDTHLEKVGISLDSNYIIAGASDDYGCTELDKLWNWEVRSEKPEAVYKIQKQQMVDACVDFCKKYSSIDALMLECTGMQPFARAIQQQVDMPVFSWGTILDYAYSVVVHRDYYGHV